MSHERFDDLAAQIDASHQARERAVHARSFEPAKDQRDRAQVFFSRRLQLVDQILNAGRRDFTAGEIRDVTTFAILLFISIAETRKSARDQMRRRSRRSIQKRCERSYDTIITELAQQSDRWITQQLVFEKRRQSWCDAGVADLRERFESRKA